MSEVSNGIGRSGLIRMVLEEEVPSGIAFSMEISTILSLTGSIPVVSRSKKARGLRSFRIWFMEI
jgi:hypothetical protein